MDLGLATITKNIFVTLGRQIGVGLLQLVVLAIIARVFGPSGNGAYALAILLPLLLATFLNFGIGPANVYFLGAKKVSPAKAWQVTVRICFYLIVIGWSVGAIILLFFRDELFPAVPTKLLYLSLACFPLVLFNGVISSFFQGLQQFKQFNTVLLLQPILNVCALSLLLWSGLNDIIYALLTYFTSLFISLCVAYKLLTKLLAQHVEPNVGIIQEAVETGANDNITARIEEPYTKHLLSYGYKAHLSNIITFVNYRADVFLLGYFLGPVAVGIYVIAVTITEKLWLLSNAVSTVILPKLSELSQAEDQRRELTPLIARWVLWITVLGAVMLLLLGSWLILIIFGNEYSDAFTAVVYLLPGIVVGSCSKVLANDIAARGRPDLNLVTSLVSVGINLAGNVVLIPIMGILGAALSTSFSYSINFFMRLAIHQHFTGVPFYKNMLLGKADIAIVKSLVKSKNNE